MDRKLFVALALVLAASGAKAGITSTLSGPPEINWYETATFTAHVEITPDAGWDGAAIDGLSYQFGSGDGRTWGQNLGGGAFGAGVVGSGYMGYAWEGSSRSFDFSVSFQYLVPGTYTPSFTITKQTTEFDNDAVLFPYFEMNGYSYQESYACGFLNMDICYRDVQVDMSRWIPAGSNVPHNFSYNRFDDASASTTLVVSIPEPETYAMMLAGLGMLGLARRRKPKL